MTCRDVMTANPSCCVPSDSVAMAFPIYRDRILADADDARARRRLESARSWMGDGSRATGFRSTSGTWVVIDDQILIDAGCMRGRRWPDSRRSRVAGWSTAGGIRSTATGIGLRSMIG